MRRFVGVVAAVLLVLPAVRSEAQKRIGVEVYFLKVQPDASARYGLEKLSQPLEDRSLHQKFFNDLPRLVKEKKVMLLDGAKVTTLEGQEASVRNDRQGISLRRGRGADGAWSLHERRAGSAVGCALSAVPKVAADGKISVMLEYRATFPGENVVLVGEDSVEIVDSAEAGSMMTGSDSILLEHGRPAILGMNVSDHFTILAVAAARIESESSPAVGGEPGEDGQLQTLSGVLVAERSKRVPDADYALRLDGDLNLFPLSGAPLKEFKEGDRLLVRGVIRTKVSPDVRQADPANPGQIPLHWAIWMDVKEARPVTSAFGK